MNGEFLKTLRELEFDQLTAREAVELRALLKGAVERSDVWFAQMADEFGFPVPKYTLPVKSVKPEVGRPPDQTQPPKVTTEPVKPPVKRRGRPVPNLKVDLKGKPKPPPIAVGGANQDGPEAPRPAQLFQESYVSKEGPRPGAALPADHPRNFLGRESSVTAEVDMSDFNEVEEAIRKGQLGKVFQ